MKGKFIEWLTFALIVVAILATITAILTATS